MCIWIIIYFCHVGIFSGSLPLFNAFLHKTSFPLIFFCRWKINGRDIDLGMDYHYSLVEGNLLINNPDKNRHGGTYQCFASNSFGTIVSREANVQFACKSFPVYLYLTYFKRSFLMCKSSLFKFVEGELFDSHPARIFFF